MNKEKVHFFTREKETREEIYDDFDYLLFTALMDTRDMLIATVQDRSIPMQKRLWKLLAVAHDFQLCVDKNELFKWEDIRKRHEDSVYGEAFCRKIQKRIHVVDATFKSGSSDTESSDRKKILFKKMWQTIVPEMEVLRPGWREFLADCLKPLYTVSDSAYQTVEEEFKLHYPDWQIQEEQLEPVIPVENKRVVAQLQRVKIKTDNGISITLPRELADDENSFAVVENGDGTISIIINKVQELKTE